MGGPMGVVRPYSTIPPTDVPIEQIAQALDHIAISLSAIDHNLETLANAVQRLAVPERQPR
jgi:hypothetical protein